ncbi:MAG: hypothetical protein LBV01_03665 [Deltaproteobacteria bacterium]|jgi:hypothetical protein|nr:hypothetical protein [Deltaproteobacteria bacterium]
MTTTSGVSGSSAVTGLAMGGEMNLATMFAMLQLEMAAEKKAQATSIINEIKAENEVLREAREHLAKARQLQSQAKNGQGPSGRVTDPSGKTYTMGANCTAETKEMYDFRKKYNIAFDTGGGDASHKSDEWELNIKNLESFIESRGMDTQTKMVQLEDLMGKYNAWSQGASKTISDGNQVLQALVTR